MHHCGRGRHFRATDDAQGHRHGGRHGHHRRGPRAGRLFDYGELRLLILAMLAERPAHGYELIKGIEEQFGGAYSPSPGVIYPTLAWLDDSGYAVAEVEEGGRKRYTATPEGQAFLAENAETVAMLKARAGGDAETRHARRNAPAPVLRGMENLKMALRLRMRRGDLDADAAEKIAAILDAAAQSVERS
ncbi:PadR family transcriptional regulator [Phenylobacterium sp. J367]|uniref:PadR family transcriptional regulator n=1 Tax=Phenylobacterium sp. J367 TaxID=2898435 RepID=UPI002150F527|nr:PadR family transcriptional regulator [Phenylobacterium sp. J367]MCR5879125.1 PadR family transcriptional regulator [Phenylobacterium sp. J367]